MTKLELTQMFPVAKKCIVLSSFSKISRSVRDILLSFTSKDCSGRIISKASNQSFSFWFPLRETWFRLGMFTYKETEIFVSWLSSRSKFLSLKRFLNAGISSRRLPTYSISLKSKSREFKLPSASCFWKVLESPTNALSWMLPIGFRRNVKLDKWLLTKSIVTYLLQFAFGRSINLISTPDKCTDFRFANLSMIKVGKTWTTELKWTNYRACESL